MRHLPPTAVPVHIRDLWRGLSALGNPDSVRESFQDAFSDYIGASHCYLASSGRAGMYLILKTLRRISDRRYVILPAYTCPTVAQAVLMAGLQVRLCDLSLGTLGMDRNALVNLIDDSVLAIIAVHPFGLPEDMPDLVALGNQKGIFIIEDAAQSLGAKLNGRRVGSFGDFSLFSLGRGKVITTGGGGVLVTSNEAYASTLREVMDSEFYRAPESGLRSLAFLAGYRLATHPRGWWFITRSPLNPADEEQNFTEPFSVGRLSAGQAGVGLSIMPYLDNINEVRRQNAEWMIDALKELPFVCIPERVPGADPVYLRLPVLVDDQALREYLFKKLQKNGIGVSRMYARPLSEIFADHIDRDGEAYPAAEYVAHHLLTLPTHHLMSDQDLNKVVETFYDGWIL